MVYCITILVSLMVYAPTILAADEGELIEVLLHNKLDGTIILESPGKGVNLSIGQGASAEISLARTTVGFVFYYQHPCNQGRILKQEIHGIKLPLGKRCELKLVSDKDNAVLIECDGAWQPYVAIAAPEIVTT